MKSLIINCFAALLMFSACSAGVKVNPEAKEMVLWYDKPAGDTWLD